MSNQWCKQKIPFTKEFVYPRSEDKIDSRNMLFSYQTTWQNIRGHWPVSDIAVLLVVDSTSIIGPMPIKEGKSSFKSSYDACVDVYLNESGSLLVHCQNLQNIKLHNHYLAVYTTNG